MTLKNSNKSIIPRERKADAEMIKKMLSEM
jgi:hypothetical protein